ncbi:O-antigen ligase family protein, partial [Klebsiella pneumoniae]
SIFQASAEKIIGKLIFYFTAALGTLIILSTSSRGGLVALVLALVIGYLLVYRANFKLILLFVLGVVLACLYVVFFNPEFIERLSIIMDLNSAQRGIGSGFSGRQDLWLMVISQFFTMNIPFVWGGGFRNEWLSEFISAVDNGYIVSIAEVGFISLLIVLIRLILAMKESIRRVRFKPNSIDATIISLVLFILAESIVARYLLAIGNAASVIILFIIIAGAKGYIHGKN